jgi:hypothetical protein|tara:strand:+ start:11478 stop:11729 length:252 start_codon:yes stop_codon:yes gene_type:complete
MEKEVVSNDFDKPSYAIDLAVQALERIARHEKECGERWSEAMVELKELKKATDTHAARWEKLAWLFVGTAVTCTATILTTTLL